MSRLLLLCRRPRHLNREEAEVWLRQQLETVLERDELRLAKLTDLENDCSEWTRNWDWLIEFEVGNGALLVTLGSGSACAELLADLRLLGMSPEVALALDRTAIEVRSA